MACRFFQDLFPTLAAAIIGGKTFWFKWSDRRRRGRSLPVMCRGRASLRFRDPASPAAEDAASRVLVAIFGLEPEKRFVGSTSETTSNEDAADDRITEVVPALGSPRPRTREEAPDDTVGASQSPARPPPRRLWRTRLNIANDTTDPRPPTVAFVNCFDGTTPKRTPRDRAGRRPIVTPDGRPGVGRRRRGGWVLPRPFRAMSVAPDPSCDDAGQRTVSSEMTSPGFSSTVVLLSVSMVSESCLLISGFLPRKVR